MSIKERRERERRELRQGILDAARAIAAREGWTAVTIRRIAEQIEYSPPTIYEYFASKEAILEEIARQGFVTQTEMFAATADAALDPTQQLLEMARRYWDFAQAAPELYQVMYDHSGTKCDFDEATALFREFGQVLRRWAVEQDMEFATLEDPAEILWAQIHGLVSLSLSGRLIDPQTRVPLLLKTAITTILSAWSAQKHI